MIEQIPSLNRLVHELTRLPGVGPKTAQRLALYILKAPTDYSKNLRQALEDVENKIRTCSRCFAYTDEEDFCRICRDPHRDPSLLCILEDASDILGVEGSGAFRGQYHILQGTISPLDGVTPEHLRIRELTDKITQGQKGEGPVVKEIIIALDADLEGDTTALYLAQQLHGRGLKVSRIAHGVPIGSNIDYIDHKTLGRAIENRVEL